MIKIYKIIKIKDIYVINNIQCLKGQYFITHLIKICIDSIHFLYSHVPSL